MVPSKSKDLMGSYSSVTGLNFEETELSLSLPGESRSVNSSGRKRRFEESVDLKLGSSSSDDCHSRTSDCDEQPKNEISNTTAKPPAKAQVVGWPPVKSTRKNMMKSSKFVKVAVDGAPYLRKVDLETYGSYEQLLTALEDMFSCLGICNIVKEKKLLDPVNGMEYVPTYEDKDGDWMLVGDVPWKMFVESCKRIRLMKGTDKETGLASPNCSSTNS